MLGSVFHSVLPTKTDAAMLFRNLPWTEQWRPLKALECLLLSLLSLHVPVCSPMWFPFPEPRLHFLLFMLYLIVKVGQFSVATGPTGLLSLRWDVHLMSHSSVGLQGLPLAPRSEVIVAYLLHTHLRYICSFTQGFLPSKQREEPKPVPYGKWTCACFVGKIHRITCVPKEARRVLDDQDISFRERQGKR